MAKKVQRAVNLVGAQEVDSYQAARLVGWEKIKFFLLSKKVKKWVWAIIRLVLLLGLGFLIIYPILQSLSVAFKSVNDLYDRTVVFIPRDFTTDNFIAIWKYINVPEAYLNSIFWSGALSLLQMVSCMFVAYGLARFKFKGRGVIFALVIITLVVPLQLLAEAMKIRYKYFDPTNMFSMNPNILWPEVPPGATPPGLPLMGSWWILALMSATAVMYKNGLFIFLLRQYFRNQPKELEEAAYIDGAGTIRTFLQVMLPSALPLLVTVFLFAFVWLYNDNYYVVVLFPNAKVMSNLIQSIGYKFVNSVLKQTNNWALMSLYDAAALILHIIPLIILYLFCQRFFVQSIERSGMVG